MSVVTHQYNSDGRAAGRIIRDWKTQEYTQTKAMVIVDCQWNAPREPSFPLARHARW